MYQEHFGLAAEPFSIAPDPSFLFLSEAHNEALAHLMYGFSHGGFVLITGEVGTGKTTLLRNLLNRTPPDLDVAFILNPRLTVRELLETLCDELGVDYGTEPLDSVKLYIDALNKHLLKTHAADRSTVMVIDEAQNLSPAVLEQVRLLTNLETNEKKLLRIILVGQPELGVMLEKTELRQLAQRVTARYHLTPLSKADVHAYVSHRLARAGGNPAIFTPAALNALYRLSRGTPRLINIIADRAMLGAYVEGLYQVTPRLIRNGAREVLGGSTKPSPALLWGGAAAVGLLLGIGAWLYFGGNLAPRSTTAAAEPSSAIPAVAAARRVSDESANLAANNTTQQANTTQSSGLANPELSSAEAATPTALPVAVDAEASQASATENTPPANTNTSTAQSISDAIQRPSGGTFSNQRRAYRAIFKQWGADYPTDAKQIPCDFAPRVGLQCLSKNGGWREISALNSPVVLELWDEQSTPYYAALLSMQGDSYQIQLGGELVGVTPKALRDRWFGRYVVLWQTPPDYNGSLREGDEHPSVGWLRNRLSELLPSAPLPGTSNYFDAPLHDAVVTFQNQQGILADGIVGPLTWIHLNSRLELPAPKLSS